MIIKEKGSIIDGGKAEKNNKFFP